MFSFSFGRRSCDPVFCSRILETSNIEHFHFHLMNSKCNVHQNINFQYLSRPQTLELLTWLLISSFRSTMSSMCNIPDYQTRAMPNTFLGNQRKVSRTSIFHFWSFNFYDILTFESKFDRIHIVIIMLQIS
jgi:hypothetical protein